MNELYLLIIMIYATSPVIREVLRPIQLGNLGAGGFFQNARGPDWGV